jgi:hypothetical protein
MKMTNQQQDYTPAYPSLMVTVKGDADDQSVAGSHSNSRTRRSKDNYRPSSFQLKNVFYNSNHRQAQPQPQPQQQRFTRPPPTSPRRHQAQYYHSHDLIHHHHQQQHYQHQPIRPLMEIKDNLVTKHANIDYDSHDTDITYREFKQREPQQRGQYRNRKAELDWDHAFDLDLIDLYPTTNDIDSYSLTSTVSSSEHSFSSI